MILVAVVTTVALQLSHRYSNADDESEPCRVGASESRQLERVRLSGPRARVTSQGAQVLAAQPAAPVVESLDKWF
jgi:hypothetical protein